MIIANAPACSYSTFTGDGMTIRSHAANAFLCENQP